MADAEPGLRRGEGRSGEYAFYWGGQSGSVRSAPVIVDTLKEHELTGWFKVDQSAVAESTGMVSVMFGIVPDSEAVNRAIAEGHLDSNEKLFRTRGKWIGFVRKELPSGEWTEIRLSIFPTRWWPGVNQVQVVVAPVGKLNKKALLLDDLTLKEVEAQ